MRPRPPSPQWGGRPPRGWSALTDRRADTPFHTARQLGPKKFAGNFGQYFPTAESTPNAALTGLDDADEPERAVFELKDVEFSRSGKSKNLSFSTRQTRSQARQNRLGISNPTVNQQILTIQNALRCVLRSCSLLIDDGEVGELYDQDYGAEGNVDTDPLTTTDCAVGQVDFGDGEGLPSGICVPCCEACSAAGPFKAAQGAG